MDVTKGFGEAGPSQVFQKLMAVSWPAGVQQLFLATGYSTLFWVIGCVGAMELAAANVLLNITLVGVLPLLGLGLASASLVGQALGAQDIDDARSWGWDVTRVGLIFVSGICLPMLFAPEWLLSLFIMESEVVHLAVLPLRITAAWLGAESVAMVLLYSLMGAGASRTTMITTICCQWLIGLPLAYFGPVLGGGLTKFGLRKGSLVQSKGSFLPGFGGDKAGLWLRFSRRERR